VRVHVPPRIRLGDVRATLNGADITGKFTPDATAQALVGLVDGMTLGTNRLEATAKGGGTARLDVVNHPITGPVFSGPQERPFFCQTHQFRIYPGGPLLTARIDPLPVRPGFPPAIPGFPPNQSSWLYNAIVPISVRYDPDGSHGGSPTGARATTSDHNVNTFGVDQHGFARRPLDNVGVQYGLEALNAGQISKAPFLDLNEKIGGLDIDANFVPARMVADDHATRAVYETGKVIMAGLSARCRSSTST
jgi:hypothetical protein